MKKVLIAVVILVLVAVASAMIYVERLKEKNVCFERVDAYMIKDTIPLDEEDFNYFIIENEDEIATLFDMKQVEPEEVDFENELLVAITTSMTNKDSVLDINAVKLIDDSLYVDFGYKDGEATKIVGIPSVIVKIKKPNVLLDLYFMQDGVMTKKIAMGRRNLNSPTSKGDLLKNFMGRFAGKFPCADCPGIGNDLVLYENMKYEYKRVYEDEADGSFAQNGDFSVSDDLVVIKLDEDDTYFYIDDKNTIELMSPDMKRINSEFNYKLRRK